MIHRQEVSRSIQIILEKCTSMHEDLLRQDFTYRKSDLVKVILICLKGNGGKGWNNACLFVLLDLLGLRNKSILIGQLSKTWDSDSYEFILPAEQLELLKKSDPVKGAFVISQTYAGIYYFINSLLKKRFLIISISRTLISQALG